VRLSTGGTLVLLASKFSEKGIACECTRALADTTCGSTKCSHVAIVREVHGNCMHCGFVSESLASVYTLRLLQTTFATESRAPDVVERRGARSASGREAKRMNKGSCSRSCLVNRTAAAAHPWFIGVP
jgi:hypothetical protein